MQTGLPYFYGKQEPVIWLQVQGWHKFILPCLSLLYLLGVCEETVLFPDSHACGVATWGLAPWLEPNNAPEVFYRKAILWNDYLTVLLSKWGEKARHFFLGLTSSLMCSRFPKDDIMEAGDFFFLDLSDECGGALPDADIPRALPQSLSSISPCRLGFRRQLRGDG